MSKDSRKTIIPFIIFAYIILVIIFVITGMFTPEGESTEIVPLTGLPMTIHNLLVVLIWPLVMSIVMVTIFPRVR